ncbi:MAG: Hsp70 family protein [Bacteroidales bacterium]
MRNKIDYGIDLGTTNSAVARMENGVPTIKKSDTLKDTVPSCIHFNKRQDILVGDTAFNVMKNDNTRALKSFEKGKTNTFIEFKRTMGTKHSYDCSNMSKSFSSEELSSEILKKLKSFIQDENISSIVITVPAKFLNPQNEATMQAAKLAGFKHIELLQEPVAAATAYGLGSKSKDGFWLVFDFGGGTFDAALIKAEEGILAVKDTDGDNWLGGKNIDDAIVDQIIIPILQQNYAIDSVLQDADKKQILRDALKFYAEEIKIEMSTKASVNYVIPLGSLKMEDENGINLEDEEIEIVSSALEFENVVAPIFQKAIDITKELMKRNNLKGSDLGALILVGGPTYSPILRRMLKEQVTDKVDTSVDPMTVVAKGAALFASTISVSDEIKETTRDKTKLQLDIKYEAATVELDEMVNLKVLKEKTTGTFPAKIYADVVRFDGAWSSGKKLIGEKATIVDVLLVEGRSNSFEINVYDDAGNKLECQPHQFSILQGIGGLDGMQVLPYHIGIGKWFQTEEKDLFKPVKGLEKNKKVPATGAENGLKTRRTIRPGVATDIIRIPIYEGDYNAEGTNPLLNHKVNEVIITGESLPALLPEGSDVDITIKIDRSRIMKFSAYFPFLNHTEELEIEINQPEPPTEEMLSKEILKAKRTAQKVNANEVSEKLETLEKQFENEKGSADGKMKILDGLRKELLKLDNAEKVAEWPKVEQDLKDAFYELESLIQKIKENNDEEELNMDKIEAEIEENRNAIEKLVTQQPTDKCKIGKDLIGKMSAIRTILLIHLIPEKFIQDFNRQYNNIHWLNPTKAKMLINQGIQIANTNYDTEQLVAIVFAIYQEMKEPNEFKETLG